MDPPAPGGKGAWEALGASAGFHGVVHSRQVHGREILIHREAAGAGGRQRLRLAGDADGHLTAQAGLLLGITVADCIPAFAVSPDPPVVGLFHAGWRGVAGGVLEEGLGLMESAFGVRPVEVHLHFGPAICGGCYEVGPEVFGELGLPTPNGPAPLDLRAILAAKALAGGVDRQNLTASAWCTRCSGSPFYSHRRGERGRQVGILGIRPGWERGPSRGGGEG